MRRTEAVAIERAKLQLEREKFEADRRSSRQVPGFFRRHFEAILTSVIAISAVLVSATQILVAEMRANVEMQRLEQEDLRNWRGDAASFIANNHKALFSPDIQIQKSFLEIIRITYPQELYRTIADSIGDFDDDPVSSVFRNSLCMDTNECKDRNDGFLKILRSCRAELSHDAINLVALIYEREWRNERADVLRCVEHDILARAIFFSTYGNGTADEMSAIGQVILNRVNDQRWFDSVSEIVLQPGHFEGWMHFDEREKILKADLNEPIYSNAVSIAEDLLAGDYDKTIENATLYHSAAQWPDFRDELPILRKVGRFFFYIRP